MRGNVRMLSDEIPAMQLARKQRFEELARESFTNEQQSLHMLGRTFVLRVLLTGCLLAWWYA